MRGTRKGKDKPADPSRPLPDGRHERYASLLAEGGPKSMIEMYVEAGFSKNRGNSSTLAGKDFIQARVQYLKERAAEKTITTVADIARQLDEDREFAVKLENASAAVSATMNKAKVLGLVVNRHLHGIKKLDEMNENELLGLLGQLEAQKED